MRPALENIEFIENYLLGNLDPSEHEASKRRIDDSLELHELLETQQCIYSAVRRKALRAEIQSYAPTTPSFFQQYRYWFMGGLAVIAFIVGLIVVNSNSVKKRTTIPSIASTLSKDEQDITPWIPFDKQYFDLFAEKGATIVGKDGTLIILASNSLIDVNGNRVKGKVQAELIEAIDWEDMLAYNLTTTSEGKALSSGGMMRIRYHQDGKEVFVDPEKPMHVEIPTEDYNPEMKVWEGEVTNAGLNWKNPQELERFLTPVDLHTLDFVPRGFDAEVAAILPYNGHSSISKQLVDSLYYSIAVNRDAFSYQESKSSFTRDCAFHIPVREDKHGYPKDQTKPLLKGDHSVTGQIVDPEGKPIGGMTVRLRMDRYLEHEEEIVTDENGYFTFEKFYSGEVSIYASLLSSNDNTGVIWKYCLESTFESPKRPKNYTLKKPLVANYSSILNVDELSVQPLTEGTFIDPLTIKTLKTSRFQNTFIATNEFEERLQAMHQLQNGSQVLNCYITNLTEPLWKCDQQAANLLSGRDQQVFEDFAAQRLTNVQNDYLHQEALTAHYTKTRNALRKENAQRLLEYQSKTQAEIQLMKTKLESALGNPTQLASAQAAIKGRAQSASSPATRIGASRSTFTVRTESYSFSWSSRSWCNIDAYLAAIGKFPWSTEITTNMKQKDIVVYKTLRDFQTILGLVDQDGIYTSISSKAEKAQDVVCVAMYREQDSTDQLYYGSCSFDPKTTRNKELDILPVGESEFYTQLCLLSPSESLIANKLKTELALLKTQTAIKRKSEPFEQAIASSKNQISTEIIVYNRLFEFLNQRNKDLVQ